MKKLILCIIMSLFIFGCFEISSIETIKKEYPGSDIHQINADEYIVVIGDEMRFIETDFAEIVVNFRIWKVAGRTNYTEELE